MACGGCGSVKGMTKAEVSNYIQSLLDNGKLQGGLKGCGGDSYLPRNAQVVLCDKLADIICDLIKTEKVCFPRIESLAYDADTEELTLVFGGENYSTHIRVTGKPITSTKNNGVYTIKQGDDVVATINTGVQGVTVVDHRLKVTKADGSEENFDLLRCPDLLISDTFGENIGYVFLTSCDTSAVPNKRWVGTHLLVANDRTHAASRGPFAGFDANPAGKSEPLVVFYIVDQSADPFPYDVTVRVRAKGVLNGVTVYDDTYTLTLPKGQKRVTVPYKTMTDAAIKAKAGIGAMMVTVESTLVRYAGYDDINIDTGVTRPRIIV